MSITGFNADFISSSISSINFGLSYIILTLKVAFFSISMIFITSLIFEYIDTLFDKPNVFEILSISFFSNNGIFFPVVDNPFVYNLYMFSVFLPGLYLISGRVSSEFINLNNISSGSSISVFEILIRSISVIPVSSYLYFTSSDSIMCIL